MNKRKLFNSKWGKIATIIVCIMTLSIVLISYCKYRENVKMKDLFDEINKDIEQVTSIVPSVTSPFKQLSEEQYEIDFENNKIYFSNEIEGGSFCVSTNPDGPGENAKWLSIDENNLDETDALDEIQKVYVYYMADMVSTITTLASNSTIYTISNAEELITFATLVNNGNNFSGKKIYLINNIQLTGSFTPIGTSSIPFAGTFDGNGYVISNLNINLSQDYVGLFGVSTGTLKNITIENGSVKGNGYVGGIVGEQRNGLVQNCTNNSVTVSCTATNNESYLYFGGIVGRGTNEVQIKYCTNKASVTGCYAPGGIVGTIGGTPNAIVYNCKNSGTVTCTYMYSMGGIVGAVGNESLTGSGTTNIEYCINTGDVINNRGYNNAGIVGYTTEPMTVNVKNCRNDGNITATCTVSKASDTGGIVGDFGKGTISRCINTGNVTSVQGRNTAGIIARMEGKETGPVVVTECLNTGTITEKSATDPSSYVYGAGGILGSNNGSSSETTNSGYGKITISYCGNTGNVTTNARYAGGIAGCGNYGGSCTISYSYNTGTLKASSSKYTGQIYAKNATSTNCYSGTQTSNPASGYFFEDTYGLGENGGYVQGWQIEPSILNHPFDVIKPVGTTETIETVVYGATSKMSYQWYVATSESGTGTAVSGAKSLTLSVTVQDSDKWYYCVITGVNSSGSACTVTSDRALVSKGGFVTDINSPGITASISPTSVTYTGSAITSPTVTVKDGTTTLTKGTDYTLSYSNNTNVGTAIVTITGIGKYSNTRTVNFDITKATNTLTVTGKTSLTYTESAQTLASTSSAQGTVYYSTSTALTSSNYTSGITTIPTETNVGTYTVYYYTPGNTNYNAKAGSVSATIKKASVGAPANLAVTTAGVVTWSAGTNATGYQISINGTNWTTATSGVNYLSEIIKSTGTRTVYVRSVNSNSTNYSTPSSNATKSVTVYQMTFASNSSTMGTVSSTSYNVISGATYSASGATLTVKGGTTTLTTVTATAKTGYNLGSWSSASGTVSAATTITANFKANTNTAYKVKHYQMNLDGSTYTLKDTDNLTGTTGASVTPTVKSYTGFTAPATQTKTILADGSLVIEYKYTRNKYYLDLNGNLDGTSYGYITNYGTADVYVNNTAISTGVADFYQQFYYGSTYEIKNITATSGHKYLGVYSGSVSGTITGATNVYLKFITNASITTHPSNVEVKVGNTASLTVGTSGYNVNYQWYYTTSNSNASGTAITSSTSGATVTGATSATLNLASIQTSWNNHYVYCQVSNDGATVKSNVAKITVYSPPSVATHPSNQTVTYPNKATFTVSATNGNPSTTTYQWQYRTSSSGAWTNVTTTQGTGGTTASFTTVATTAAMSGYQYRCVLSNAQYSNAAYSNEATLTVNKATASVTASITGETTVGKTLTATVSTSADGTKSYQWWHSSTAGATSGTAISGATLSTYTITSSMVGYYIGVTVSVAEGTNYKACSGTAITTSKVAGTNYKDSAGNYYETLKEAFDNAASGSTITVLKDNTDSSTATVASGKTFTLNTNGKTVTKTTGRITNNGTLTIQGTGTIQTLEYSSNNLHTLIDNNGQLTVKEVTLHNKGISSSYWYTIQNPSGTTNIQSGTIKASGTDSTYNARVMYISSGTINISGGTIESSCIGIHSYSNTTGTINITGGVFTTNNNTVLNITGSNNQTNLNITGGTLISETSEAVTLNTTGTVNIGTNDGTVSRTSPVIQGKTYAVNTTNAFYFYDGILKGKTAGHYGTPTLASGYGLQYGTEVIDGTTYQTEILALTNWSDGKSVYSTLEDAFEKAKTGSTITALKDITDNSTNATLNKSMTIDLDGHVVNMPNSSINVESSGNLEIIGKTGSKITSGNDIAIVNNGGGATLGTTEGDISNWPKVEGNKKGAMGDITMNGGTLIGTDNPPYGTKPTTERDYFEIITKKNGTKYETTIQLEQVPPEITITPSTEKPTNEDVILTIKVTDNFSGVKKVTYELDGEVYDLTLNSSGIGTIKVSENGTYTIYAEDNAGNKSNKTYEVKNIDRIPDNVTGASVQDATGEENKVKYATIILENITTDSVLPSEVVEILISNSSTGVGTGTWIPYETDMKAPWVLDTTDGNGEKTIYIWAKDNAGNISENPFSLKVTLDTKLIGGTKNKISLLFAGIDKNFDRSELQNYQIGYKTGNASAIATQTELSKIDEKFTYGDKTGEKFSLTTRNIKGAGKLYVTVATRTLYDKAGNVNDVAEIETDYTIDTNAPTITYDASTGNVKITDTEGNLKAITVDGKTITISNNGTYNISSGYIRAYDLAGNVAELSL